LAFLPFGGRVGGVERVAQLDHLAVLLLEAVGHVELNQLGQSGELLTAVQVEEVTGALDFDMRNLPIPSAT